MNRAKSKTTGQVESSFKKSHNPLKHSEEVQLNVCIDVEEHGQTSIRDVSCRTGEVYLNVCLHIGEHGQTSIREMFLAELALKETVRKILHKSKVETYKPKFINTLKEQDFDIRLGFSFWY